MPLLTVLKFRVVLARFAMLGTAVFAVLLLTGSAIAHADEQPPVGPCGDVRFVGVKGSGQTGEYLDYGREMYTLSYDLSAAMPLWVHFRTTPVNYPAQDFLLAVADREAYAESVIFGQHSLESMLAAIEQWCPDEMVVLAGYSSGAIIVHDVLDDIADDPHWQTHVAGVHLLADPRRVGDDPVTAGGAASTTIGIDALGLPGVAAPAPVPALFGPITKSWCVPRDPICALSDPTTASAALALAKDHARHSSYGDTLLPQLFENEAARLSRRFEFEFPPRDRTVSQVAAGYPINIDLKDGFTHSVRFTNPSPIAGTKVVGGFLQGVIKTPGTYTTEIAADTNVGGTSRFTLSLEVVEPIETVPFDPDHVAIAPLPLRQATGIALPSIPARSVVSLEPDTPMPAGLSLTAAGKIQGRPDLVGSFVVGVRAAQANGALRRFWVDLNVVNPATLVSAAADGTPSDAENSEGVMLDDQRVAFTSAADNLGAGDPGGLEDVYLKDTASGALAFWAPPNGENVCALFTDETKATLFVATTSFREFTNDNGDPDSQELTTIRQLPVAARNYPSAAVVLTTVGTYPGDCNFGATVAASSTLGVVVVSPYRLDLPGQPVADGELSQRLYAFGAGGFISLIGPRTETVPWSPTRVLDIRSNGDVLVEAQTFAVGTTEEPGLTTTTGSFSIGANRTWRRVDVDDIGHAIDMQRPRYYAGGIVYTTDADGPSSARGLAALAIGGDSGVLRFKALGAAAPTPFGAVGLHAPFGIQPLSGADYTLTVGCTTYNRNKSGRVEPTTVFLDGQSVDSCLASAPGNGATPLAASGTDKMLVTGSVDGTRQLLTAAIP